MRYHAGLAIATTICLGVFVALAFAPNWARVAVVIACPVFMAGLFWWEERKPLGEIDHWCSRVDREWDEHERVRTDRGGFSG